MDVVATRTHAQHVIAYVVCWLYCLPCTLCYVRSKYAHTIMDVEATRTHAQHVIAYVVC